MAAIRALNIFFDFEMLYLLTSGVEGIEVATSLKSILLSSGVLKSRLRKERVSLLSVVDSSSGKVL